MTRSVLEIRGRKASISVPQQQLLTMSTAGQPKLSSDSFQLYDLRVEAVCPEGERVWCGAKPGDYFTLEGEMMYLPPNQGISIYSLGTLSSL
jgi:hypothetical protein